MLTVKLGAGISGVAPNGHNRRHKEPIIPIESGLGWHVARFAAVRAGLRERPGHPAVLAGDDCSARSLKGKEIRRFRPI